MVSDVSPLLNQGWQDVHSRNDIEVSAASAFAKNIHMRLIRAYEYDMNSDCDTMILFMFTFT